MLALEGALRYRIDIHWALKPTGWTDKAKFDVDILDFTFTFPRNVHWHLQVCSRVFATSILQEIICIPASIHCLSCSFDVNELLVDRSYHGIRM